MGALRIEDRVPLPVDKPAKREPDRIALPTATPPSDMPKEGISLTPRAARAFREILASKGGGHGALKVSVTGGGCAGFQYGMALARQAEPTDIVIESQGVPVYLDGPSVHMLASAEVDFIDSMMGRGFTVRNPNAASTCGCGSSFNTTGAAPTEGACTTSA